MGDAQNQVQDGQDKQKKDVNQAPTIHSGGNVESAPISTETAKDKVENYVEDSGEHQEPKVNNQVKNVVKVKRDIPEIDEDARRVGVEHSIPKGPNYSYKNSYKDERQAKQEFEKGDIASANTFRALEFMKNIKKGLLGALSSS